jgi:toxin ParE1/3/4
MEVIIAPQARRDIVSILAWTEENFGPQTLKRYAKLIATAIEQIAEDPDLAGSMQGPEIAQNCRTYHLFFSRKSASQAGNRVRHPRHFIVYRVTESDIVEIARVLHDSMDIQSNLPDELRGSQT